MPLSESAQSMLNVVTTTDIKVDLIREIDKIQVELSKITPFDYENIQKCYPLTYKVMQYTGFQLDTKSSQYMTEFLMKLKNQLKDLNEVIFYVSPSLADYFSKEARLVLELVAWFRINVDPGSILDIQSREDIVAGYAYSFKGRYCEVTMDQLLGKIIYDKV